MSANYADLINRHPETYKEEDLDLIIKMHRENRHKFIGGNTSAGSAKAMSAEQQKLQKIEIKL